MTKAAGHERVSGKVGANSVRLPVKGLKAGRYRITVTVTGSNGEPIVVTRTLVVKAKKKK